MAAVSFIYSGRGLIYEQSYTSGGIGIGLAIARYLVELHHGTIEVTSKGEGRGATFLESSEEPDRILYLAVPGYVYQTFLKFEPAKTVIDRYDVRLIVYNSNQEVIEQWIE